MMRFFSATLLELALVLLGAWIWSEAEWSVGEGIFPCLLLFGVMLWIWNAIVGFDKKRDPSRERFGEDASANAFAPGPFPKTSPAVFSAPNPPTRNPAPSRTPNPVSAEWNRERLAQAMEELETGALDKGAWAEALIRTDGDEAKAKLEYLKIRGAQGARTECAKGREEVS